MLLLVARDGEHCVWCRQQLTHVSPEATVDHVRCRSRGGSNTLDNLVLACARCNHRRSDQPADAWLWRCVALGLSVDRVAVTAAIRRAEGAWARTWVFIEWYVAAIKGELLPELLRTALAAVECGHSSLVAWPCRRHGAL